MNHRVFGRKLSRTKNERRRLLQGLAREMFVHGKIVTTRAKAKAVQPLIEKLVTHAKVGSNANVRQIRKVLAQKESVDKLLADAKTRFATRTSGYTRILHLASRPSDNAQMAHLSFVDSIVETEVIKPKETKKEVKVEKPKKKVVSKKKKS